MTGYIARRRGAQEEGVRNLQRAVQLDPRNIFTLQQLALSYQNLRRYAETIATLDRVFSIKPDDPETRTARAFPLFSWKADTRPLREAVDEIRAKNPEAVKSIADVWFLCALAEHDPASAEMALAALGNATFGDDAIQLNAAFGRGLLARKTRDDAKARAAFGPIRQQQEKTVQEDPNYGPAHCILALIDAGLGQKEDALREARRAVELTPVEKDSLNGSDVMHYSVVAAAWVGEKDLALENLSKAAQLPGLFSYGHLKLLPWYDPLRADPRFEKIVNSLAPKN